MILLSFGFVEQYNILKDNIVQLDNKLDIFCFRWQSAAWYNLS